MLGLKDLLIKKKTKQNDQIASIVYIKFRKYQKKKNKPKQEKSVIRHSKIGISTFCLNHEFGQN